MNERNDKAPQTREERAAIEVGHTDVSPAVSRFLLVGFLAVLLVVPLIDQIASTSGGKDAPSVLHVLDILPTPDALSRSMDQEGLLGSILDTNADMLRAANLFEDDLEDQSEVSLALIPPMQRLLVGRLRAGNESVYCGRDGWLFFRPGIDYLTGRGFLNEATLTRRARGGDELTAPPQPDPLKAMVAFRDQLAARGIALVVVPAPVKPTIYPEKFSGRHDGTRRLQNASFDALKETLQKEGIHFFDPAPALDAAKQAAAGPLYLKTDTHWTPEGLRITAEGLAAYLRDEELLPEGASREYVRRPSEVENYGDLAAMLELPESANFYPPESVTIQQVFDDTDTPWSIDSGAEILLLGDSFANIYSLDGMEWGEHAGFAQQLSAQLERPLDTIIINDAGAHATRTAIAAAAARGQDRLAGKRLVIWEFAARELAVGDWRLGLDYTPDMQMTTTATTGGTIRVTGSIAGVTRPPRPGSVPYEDCVTAVHLVDIDSDDTDAGDMVVFLWGMRDNLWTPAARFVAGTELTLDVVPWQQAEARYGSYNRIEFDDDALLAFNPYWAVVPADEIQARVDETPKQEGLKALPIREALPLPEIDSPFLIELREKAQELEDNERKAFLGKDGWMFVDRELRHLGAGPFWGDDAKAVSRSRVPDAEDPLPAIVDFHEQLERAGIELIVMPVPPKAIIYPDMISQSVEVSPGETPPRLDIHLQAFYKDLRDSGVQVLDLTPEFLAHRFDAGVPLYCRQDSHWAGTGIELAAAAIAERLANRPWMSDLERLETVTEQREVEIAGDLTKFIEVDDTGTERIPLTFVLDAESGSPVQTSRESPILLIGDSHTLVFSSGDDMHATGAGLPEHLAHLLGAQLDLVGLRGSNATAVRMSLLRRRDDMAGKKVVIWCFRAREFTEGTEGWRKIPVIRN